MLELQINAVDALLLIGTSLATMYMGYRIQVSSFRVLSLLLSAFLLVHGVYHLLDFIGGLGNNGGLDLVNETFVGPLDLTLLLAFAIYYAKRAG